MEFRSQAEKAWSRALIHRTRESMSMSPVLRPAPSRKIRTLESFFWFRKPGNGTDGISDIEGKATRVGASKPGGERVSIIDGISDMQWIRNSTLTGAFTSASPWPG